MCVCVCVCVCVCACVCVYLVVPSFTSFQPTSNLGLRQLSKINVVSVNVI